LAFLGNDIDNGGLISPVRVGFGLAYEISYRRGSVFGPFTIEYKCINARFSSQGSVGGYVLITVQVQQK
jgi:hypothetical protein